MREYPIKIEDGMKFHTSTEGTLISRHAFNGQVRVKEGDQEGSFDLLEELRSLDTKHIHIIIFVEE